MGELEKLPRALWECDSGPWELAPEKAKAVCRFQVEAILSAMQPTDAQVEVVGDALEKARCPDREGPFGGYDYGHPDDKPVPGGRYVVRDFRDPSSPGWGKWVHQTDDPEVHDAMYAKMTRDHITHAAITAFLESFGGKE